jgi:hypothetical protein
VKFKATVETTQRSYDVEFELDDETAASARLSEVLADISKRYLRKTERPEKPAAAVKTGSQSQASAKPPAA